MTSGDPRRSSASTCGSVRAAIAPSDRPRVSLDRGTPLQDQRTHLAPAPRGLSRMRNIRVSRLPPGRLGSARGKLNHARSSGPVRTSPAALCVSREVADYGQGRPLFSMCSALESGRPRLAGHSHFRAHVRGAREVVRYRETKFELGNLSRVLGVTLVDGREVVIKIRRWESRLLGCVAVQRKLARAGFPCPTSRSNMSYVPFK